MSISDSETDSSECRGAFAQREITFKESKEETDFLVFMLNSLKTLKTKLKVNKRLNKTAGDFDENMTKIVIQNIGIALFQWAKKKDHPKHCDKQNVTKLFYSAGALLGVSAVFGEMDQDIGHMREYANRRATVLNICCVPNPFEAQPEETLNRQPKLNLKSTKENDGNSTGEELINESSISGSFLDKPTSSNQWSHGNPTGKRMYDRDFIHSLRFIPVSLKRPKYLPSLEVVRGQKTLNTLSIILNTFTTTTCYIFVKRIQILKIRTELELANIVEFIFEKATLGITDNRMPFICAKICKGLSSKEVPMSESPAKTTNFRKLLLTKCQRQFEMNSAGYTDAKKIKMEIDKCKDKIVKNNREKLLKVLVKRNWEQTLGNIRFISELYKMMIIPAKIIHNCIAQLLAQPSNEKSLECICVLLTNVGKYLELSSSTQTSTSSSGNIMDSYFNNLKNVVMKNRLVSLKILSMIMDVIDLRRNYWKSQQRDAFSNWKSQLMNNNGTVEQESSSQLEGAVGYTDDPVALEEINAAGPGTFKANDSSTSFVPAEFRFNLEQYLREGKKVIQDVFEWIKNFSIDTWDPLFIRALVIAVIESCIDGSGTESRLNYSSLKHYAAVLKRYVQNVDDSELEMFFAVQNLATQRQHPEGLIQGIFETLYDCEVISKKGFESWIDNNDPSQQKDNFEALNSASFVTWFEETDDYESDQVLALNNSLYTRSNFRNLY